MNFSCLISHSVYLSLLLARSQHLISTSPCLEAQLRADYSALLSKLSKNSIPKQIITYFTVTVARQYRLFWKLFGYFTVMGGETSNIQHLEVDSGEQEDNASVYSDNSSYCTPGPPSILDYKYENGRRYHAFREGSYLMPNDEREQERLDLAHQIYKAIVHGALYRAPLPPNPRRVLDIGTGTGIWAIDFADEHPNSDVLGTDLSLIQPTVVPANCRFIIDDVRSPWAFEDKFDYIHSRCMLGAIGDWDALVSEIFDNLTDGGWVELQEVESRFRADDDSIQHAPNTRLWNEKFNEAGRLFGQRVDIAPRQREFLEKAGFVDIREEIYKIPVGSWPKDRRLKDLGRAMFIHMVEGLEAVSLAFFNRVLGWSREQIDELIAGVVNELRSSKNHLYFNFYFTYGRKPPGGEAHPQI